MAKFKGNGPSSRRGNGGRASYSKGYTGVRGQKSTRRRKRRTSKSEKSLSEMVMGRHQTGNTFTATVLFYLSVLIVIVTLPFSLFFICDVVPQYLRVCILRMGRLTEKIKGPGIVFYIPCTDELYYIDLRTDYMILEPQIVLTKDSVTVYINLIVFYHPTNTHKILTMVDDYESALSFVAQTEIREIFGEKYLHELLSEKHVLIHLMRDNLDAKTTPWGLTIERVEIIDISLPEEMMRSLAVEAEASRQAKAKVIAAEGEHKAAEKLKIASQYLAESEEALQMRYLQTMATVAHGPNTTICFPFPLSFEPMMHSLQM